MNRFFPIYICSIFFLGSMLGAFTTNANAQKKDLQSGEIQMEFTEEKKEDPYALTIESIFSKLDTFQTNLQSGSFVEPPLFTQEELTFLAATHLYCTLREGVCTLIPFTLFEIELVRGSHQKSPNCPNLIRFWKQWISADMEKRVGLNLKVVHYNKRTDYKEKVRPKLLKCSATIKSLLGEQDNVQTFFSSRYEAGKAKAELVNQLKNYIIEMNKKVPNIYRETGVRR